MTLGPHGSPRHAEDLMSKHMGFVCWRLEDLLSMPYLDLDY